MTELAVVHIVGTARTIRTAVLCVEWLRDYSGVPNKDGIKYRFKEPSPSNGWWSADIVYEGALAYEVSGRLVDLCRAFVAGAGEVW